MERDLTKPNDSDPRTALAAVDWRHERAEELADALVYGAIAEVANETERRGP